MDRRKIGAIWEAFLAAPHLSVAAGMSSLVPCGFGSFPAIASSPGLLLPLPGLTARGAVTSEHATQGRLCLVTAGSELELITYIPKGWSVTPKTSCRKTRARRGAGRAVAGRRGERGTVQFAITPLCIRLVSLTRSTVNGEWEAPPN